MTELVWRHPDGYDRKLDTFLAIPQPAKDGLPHGYYKYPGTLTGIIEIPAEQVIRIRLGHREVSR